MSHATRLSKIGGVMYNTTQVLGTKTLVTLYYAFFLPIIRYCCEVSGTTYTINVHFVTIVQEGYQNDIWCWEMTSHTSMLLYDYKVLTFQNLVHLTILSIIFKAYNNLPLPVTV